MGGGNPLTLPSRFYQVGPSLSLPIFDGGRLRANLAGKDAQYDLAVAQYNQTLVGALNQVADEVSALQSLDEQIGAQQRAQDAAQQAWQLAEQRYKAGIGSYLEALSVRQQLLLAERGTRGARRAAGGCFAAADPGPRRRLPAAGRHGRHSRLPPHPRS